MKQHNKKAEYEMRVLAAGKRGGDKDKMRNMLGGCYLNEKMRIGEIEVSEDNLWDTLKFDLLS